MVCVANQFGVRTIDRRHLEDAAVSHAHLRGLLLIPVGGLFLLAALANWDVVQTWALAVGVVVVGLLWLVAMGVGYALGPGLRTHHVVILGALLVAGALPVWDGADSANAGLLLAGIAVALTGIFDHRAFLHTFGPTVDAGA
jgi:hypothetical protein